MAASFSRCVCFALSVVYFFTNSLFAHTVEMNLWAERKKNFPPAIPTHRPNDVEEALSPILHSLSFAFGTVRRVSLPTKPWNGNVVVCVQDVHRNVEAQTNIAKALQALINRKLVGLVALE